MDCLLCPGGVPLIQMASPPTRLLGMVVCEHCTRDFLRGPGGNWMEKVPPDVMAWAILVLRMMHTHKLEHCRLRLSTRLAHAELAELEVELMDLRDSCYPTLEVDVHGFVGLTVGM